MGPLAESAEIADISIRCAKKGHTENTETTEIFL